MIKIKKENTKDFHKRLIYTDKSKCYPVFPTKMYEKMFGSQVR